ncbi:alpha/beta hydrolase family protein [Alkalihalobacillus pseudalcaliphilus]|uniref:alpha/beta hydrolase family protein n=1 Tax=Alkalihalobacillus pseudalcaliphilus TaxID=79884 RepID=UPI00064DAC1F|nr:prolyl oligopeptidase family serine peptidase [Alkalihalobacillus pseudalcaliphilus]KMK77777.1 peptidase [Alkalihalobacillus pseudalcaliphilus]
MLLEKKRIPSPHQRIDLFEITYLSAGLQVKGYLATPLNKGKLPGLLYLRGGIKNVGMVRVQRVIQWASEGFVVIAPFYRGNRGGEGQEDFAGEDREDAFKAYDLLYESEEVQHNQIHALGFSRGGVMALLTALKRPSLASCVLWNGVTDMFLTYEERIDLRRMMKRVIGGTPNKYPERYQERSPIPELKQSAVPILTIHGMLDEHVSIEHSYRLENALHGHVQSWYYPHFSHHFPLKDQQRILTEAANWMKKQTSSPQK